VKFIDFDISISTNNHSPLYYSPAAVRTLLSYTEICRRHYLCVSVRNGRLKVH